MEILLFADDTPEVLSLCICILTFPLYIFLKNLLSGCQSSPLSVFHKIGGVFGQISTEKFFVLLLCQILLCR